MIKEKKREQWRCLLCAVLPETHCSCLGAWRQAALLGLRVGREDTGNAILAWERTIQSVATVMLHYHLSQDSEPPKLVALNVRTLNPEALEIRLLQSPPFQ